MSVSVRSHLVAGVAALAVSATVLAPVAVSVPAPERPVLAPRVDLAASVKPLVIEPLSPEQVATARAVIERIDPEAQLPVEAAAIVAPTPQNAASDAIIAGYQFIQYWVDYGVTLADYVLGFIPYGYLIGDQVSIVYFNLVRPISDSVVYGLIVPVVNDPLNIWSYVNGAVVVGQTTINALINTGIAEFNYFFGWLIPPLPPLPLAATEATTLKTAEVTAESVDEPATELAAEAATVDEHDASAADAVEATPAEPESAETPEGEVTEVEAEPVTPEPEADEKKPESTTTTSEGGVEAQGEVRGGEENAANTKPADESKPGTPKDDGDGPEKQKPAANPAESGAGGTGTDTEDTTRDAGKDAEKDTGSAKD